MHISVELNLATGDYFTSLTCVSQGLMLLIRCLGEMHLIAMHGLDLIGQLYTGRVQDLNVHFHILATILRKFMKCTL